MKYIIVGILSSLLTLSSCASNQVDTSRTLLREDVIKKYATDQTRFVNLEGVDVHYRDEGKGPAILLVHGTLGDLSDWDEWANELKSNYRVIRMDLPGFGISGHMPNNNYSVDRMNSLIDSLMDHLEQEKFSIVGISYGGIITFRYAATRKDRITAMVLLNSAGIQAGQRASVPPTKTTKTDKPKSKANRNFMSSPVVNKIDIEYFYQGYINDPTRRTPELIQRKLDFLNIVGRDEVAHFARGLYERGNPQRVLSHVKAPSLILWGEGNQALATETAQAFVDALTNSCSVELLTFKEGGHYINVERPLETVRPAIDFFNRVLLDKSITACQPDCSAPL